MAAFYELLKNKKYITCLIMATIAAFGFEITHLSLGIDDFGVDHYLSLDPDNHGNMVQQGRLLHLALFYLTGLVDVIPFLNNFIAASLFSLSALVLCALAQKASNDFFSINQLILASCLFVSYPIIAFKFIYDLDVIVTMTSYLCVPLSIYCLVLFEESKQARNLLAGLLFLVVAISSYESFNAVYVCEVLIVLFLNHLTTDTHPAEIIKRGLRFALLLIGALIVYYALVKTVQFATGNPQYTRANVLSNGLSFSPIVWRIFASDLQFSRVFTASCLLLTSAAAFFAIKEKKTLLMLLALAIIAFSLAIQIIQGAVFYRTCQSFCLVLFFSVLLAFKIVEPFSLGKKLAYALAIILVLCQLRSLNSWFYQDWVNYQKNVYAIHNIATELVADYDTTKPVCFVNRDYESFLMTWDSYQTEIGESPIISSVRFLGDMSSPATIYLFEKQGYRFLIEPTDEQAQKAAELSEGMPAYPHDGYIMETDEFIIVNFGVWEEE